MAEPINGRVRKNLEVSFLVLTRPSLDEQIVSKNFLLFQTVLNDNFLLLVCDYV